MELLDSGIEDSVLFTSTPSSCSSFLLHNRHLCIDLQALVKWPVLRQFVHILLDFTIASLSLTQ